MPRFGSSARALTPPFPNGIMQRKPWPATAPIVSSSEKRVERFSAFANGSPREARHLLFFRETAAGRQTAEDYQSVHTALVVCPKGKRPPAFGWPALPPAKRGPAASEGQDNGTRRQNPMKGLAHFSIAISSKEGAFSLSILGAPFPQKNMPGAGILPCHPESKKKRRER